MSKQLTPEIKSSPMFLFAKVKGLNSREASRFNSLFTSEADFLNITTKEFGKTITISYLEFCKEPKINKSMFLTAIPGTEPDTVSVSRSKLVMAYEKQRKAYLKLKELRHLKSDEVDNLMIQANPYADNIPNNMTYRMFVLQHILRYISTTNPTN
jgi:hypothetical protein